MNEGEEILKRQDTETNIDKLLAQRKLYSYAKTFKWSFVFITIIFPIIISLLDNFRVEEIKEWKNIYIIYVVIAFIIGIIFDNLTNNYKDKAAVIQEEFDISVFSIPKRKYLINMIDANPNIIRKYSKKDKENTNKVEAVKNWYPIEIGKVRTNISVLLCQRANVYYDETVRIIYKRGLIVLSILFFIVLLFMSLIKGFTIEALLYKVLIPMLPIVSFLHEENKDVNASINNLKNLKEKIEGLLEGLSINEIIETQDLREVQDMIYYNRKLSVLIPDFIYKIFRNDSEDEMNYSIEKTIEKLKERTKKI